MRQTPMSRMLLAALLLVVVAVPVARAASDPSHDGVTFIHTLSLDDLTERLPVVHFALHNPYYDGELKVYRGFYLADVVSLLTPYRDGVVHFAARDGYRQQMDLAEIFEDDEIIGILAFEQIGHPGGFEPFSPYGEYIEDLGPYFLVWGHINPHDVSDGGASLIDTKPWPWQLIEIRIER